MKAEQLRKSILQLAIQGKLVPQDPADEPASVLLERIRAEKQSLIKQGKIKKDKGDSVIFKGDDNCYYEKTGSEVKNITDEIPFDIPDSWCWTRLGNLITIISGVSYDKKDVCNNGIRILRGGNVNDLKITTFPEDVFLPEKYHDTDKQIRKNDIIVVASTGSKTVIGKAGYVDVDVFNTQIGAFLRIVRPLLGIIAPYLKLIFATEYYREHIRTQSQGTNINNVKAEYITEFRIPFPPLAEQERIVAEIEKFEPLIAEYDKLEQQATKLDGEIYDKLKKSILQYAIQGKLVPQDKNDEPASELLKRIRAEKKAQLGKKYVESYIFKGDDNCYYEKVDLETKNITDEIPFDIPDTWEWARVDTLFQHNTGKALNSANTKGNYREYITTSNLYWNYFKVDSLKKMLFTDEEIDKCSLKKGDLLVCEGGDIGRSAIWNFDIPMCIQNHIHRLRAYFAVETKFYYCVLYLYKQLGIIGGKGIGIQGLSTKALGRIIFPVPPLAEQKRIIEQINVIFSKLKDEI